MVSILHRADSFAPTKLCQDFHSRGAVNHCNVSRCLFSRPGMASESQMGMGNGLKGSVLSLTPWQLTDAERSRLLARLDKDSDDAVREEFAWKYVRQAFVDPLVWGYALLNHGFAFTLYTLSLFLVCLYQVAHSSPCTNASIA
jgi:hypothetical protein